MWRGREGAIKDAARLFFHEEEGLRGEGAKEGERRGGVNGADVTAGMAGAPSSRSWDSFRDTPISCGGRNTPGRECSLKLNYQEAGVGTRLRVVCLYILISSSSS